MSDIPAKDGAAVERIIDLAKEAGAEIVEIENTNKIAGLPASMPVLLNKKTGAASGIAGILENYRFAPARKSGTAEVTTLESFVSLTNRHKTDDSVIFADANWQKPSLTAIIDYHEAKTKGLADNGGHRVHYEFPLSEQWKAWVGVNGKPMDQEKFAQFIEDHIADLATPDETEELEYQHKFSFRVAFPNELVMLSRGLQVLSEARVKNAVSLQSGAGQIVFEEEHKDINGNRLDVPGMFILSVPPFFMGEVTRIPVRLRYRVSAGSVVWSILLYRPDIYITEQVNRVLTLAASETTLPAFQGTPEMSA